MNYLLCFLLTSLKAASISASPTEEHCCLFKVCVQVRNEMEKPSKDVYVSMH